MKDIIRSISKQLGKPTKDIELYFNEFQSVIEDALLSDKIVKISGLGTFKLVWNKPRKSVDVRTGESIELEGYYKPIFVPETSLKELVNAPYSHLEVLTLNDDDSNHALPNEQDESPLAALAEQAKELSKLVHDINANVENTHEENPIIEEQQEEIIITEEPQEEQIKTEEYHEEIILVSDTIVIEEEICTTDEIVEEPIILTTAADDTHHEQPNNEGDKSMEETRNNSNIFGTSSINDEPQQHGKSRKKLWITLSILAVILLTVPVFFIDDLKSLFLKQQNAEVVVEAVEDTVSEVVSEVVETTTIDEPVYHLGRNEDGYLTAQCRSTFGNELFDEERVYDNFSKTVSLNEGSRLAYLSEKEYGNAYFWVYIYEANHDVIDDPNIINVGIQINIPILPAELIDANNPYCIQYAKELHQQYVVK